jgi:metal-dependent HD superfamily phosphatase/phosphodiesterase
MSEGRSRIPYQAGKVDIYSLSAAAIDSVRIAESVEAGDKPIQITVTMNSSAGLFQVEELLKPKLIGSGIELYVKVRAILEKEKEQRLIDEYEIR